MPGKPRTLAEAALVEARLRDKYPQMYEKTWKKRAEKGKKAKEKAKNSEEKRNESSLSRIRRERKARRNSLAEALTAEEINRFMGK